MKKPFEVGERVAVYNEGIRNISRILEICSVTGNLRVNEFVWVSPQQCRRLILKKRQRLFIVSYNNNQCGAHPNIFYDKLPDWASSADMKEYVTEFVEVKKK